MARKAAKKKHRGIRDPLKLIEQRNNKLKDKINRKPKNDTAQEIPRSLQRIVDFQKDLKSGLTQKKKTDDDQAGIQMEGYGKKKKQHLIDTSILEPMAKKEHGMDRPLAMVPHLKQNRGESDAAFLKRVKFETEAVLNEAKFEDKYNVDVLRDMSGSVSKVRHRSLLDDPALSAKTRAKLEKRLQLKKEKKKERDYKRKHKNKKFRDDGDGFEQLQDKVEFGDVVYEPPSLDTSRFTKMTAGETKSKSFLFMDKLKASQSAKLPEKTLARKRDLEIERLKAVQAYREMKAAKYSADKNTIPIV